MPAAGAFVRAAGLAVNLPGRDVLWTAVSGAALERLRPLVGPDASTAVLPNAVDVDWWHTAPQTQDDDERVVVSVLRMTQRKRPIPLLRMLRQVRQQAPASRRLRAVLVGAGPERAAAQRYLRRHAMTSWVHLTGPLDRARIRRLLAGSHVYVAPAPLESFGIAALEARAAGLPVVASTRGGVGEFVEHGRHGLLADSDESMVAVLTQLVTDDALLADLTAHSRLHRPALDWDAAHEAALAAYARAAVIAAPRISHRPRVAVGR
ncbi:MAG: glycosyltransferase family 4 protein, partial [Nocardioides sp.]